MAPQDTDEDLTRKQRREQARAQRRALEEAEAAGASRRRRLQLLGGAVAVVAVAVIIILVAAGGGSGKTHLEKSSGGGQTPTAKAVGELLNGIPQSGNALGKSTAPVTLQYFGDLECPICQKFTLGALPFIIDRWVRAGDLRIEYRSLETATREPETFRKQQVAAYAAGAQDKAWYFIETFYHEQGEEDSGYVTESYIDEIAKQVPGLNLSAWQQERNNKKYVSEIEEDAQAANNEGFTGTPSFLIGRSGGQLKKYEYTSLTEANGWNEEIEKLIRS